MTIIVNGKPKEWLEDSISYRDLILISNYVYNPKIVYTITYNLSETSPITNTAYSYGATLIPLQSVTVREGMKFNICFTGNA